jgi:uncharacterized membrane-anchored protein YhcB (DUF1043 family)
MADVNQLGHLGDSMTEIGLAFIIGFMIGLVMRPKDKDAQEQYTLYDRQIKAQEEVIQYYKKLCKWHVERANEHH